VGESEKNVMTQTMEITLPELMERVRKGQIPSTAKIQVTFEEVTVPPKDPTIALFEQWAQEDAALTQEQQQENQRIYSEIEQNGIPRVRIGDNR
jgi:hypothetical protein